MTRTQVPGARNFQNLPINQEDKMNSKRIKGLSRRSTLKLLATTGAAVALPSLWQRTDAADTLVISDAGGTYSTAFKKAFYEPFSKETGVTVVQVARRNAPLAEIKAMVETKNYQWDMTGSIQSDSIPKLREGNLLEKLDLSGSDIAAIPDNMKSDLFLGNSVITFLLGYRTDRFKTDRPQNFADIWETKKFPGRRAMRNLARDMIEVALRADGVPGGDEIYKVLATPAGWSRAFAKLDAIKPEVKVWYSQSTESTQLLQTGEVDMIPLFNARAQVAVDAGAPVGFTWKNAFYGVEGWAIPKGTPKADLARKFVKWAANPQRQAEAAAILTNGPCNPNALQFIDKKRVELLPTFPENFKVQTPLNDDFWAANADQANQRFSEWLLKK